MPTKEQKYEYNQKYYKEHHQEILNQKKRKWQDPEFKEFRTEYQRNWYEENKEEQVRSQREYYSKPENRVKKIFGKARERAKEVGIEFSIQLEDIIIPELCPYLGIKLTHSLGKGQLLTNSSIDRIDNSKGYVPGNVRIISRLANNMKTNSSREQREAFARAVLNDLTL